MTKYFLVFYTGYLNGACTGQISISTKNPFLGSTRTDNLIKSRHPTITDLLVTNIIELTEEQYIYWNNN